MTRLAPTPEDWLAAVEEEIKGEKALTLGRRGEKLEAALAALPALRQAADAAAPDERPLAVGAYNAMRLQALRAYEFLCIEREAMGLRNHELLAAVYVIPPKLR